MTFEEFANSELGKALVEGILGWPFLLSVVLIIFFVKFQSEFRDRLKAVHELTIGGKTKISMGTQEVEASELGAALNQALQELETRVEKLEGKQANPELSEANDTNEIPPEIRERLWKLVYPMLQSDRWSGRKVSTLAENSGVSRNLMRKFLSERDEVQAFELNGREFAFLKSRGSPADITPKDFIDLSTAS